jgi:hypothetical protein
LTQHFHFEPFVVTDAWFDADTPNDLHPVGVIIDPVNRRIEVPSKVGSVLRQSYFDASLVGRDHDGTIVKWFAGVGDVIVIGRDPKLTLRDVWRE